jgi:hypothetical protein
MWYDLAISLANPSGETRDNLLVQMISTCLRYLRGRGEGVITLCCNPICDERTQTKAIMCSTVFIYKIFFNSKYIVFCLYRNSHQKYDKHIALTLFLFVKNIDTPLQIRIRMAQEGCMFHNGARRKLGTPEILTVDYAPTNNEQQNSF